VQREVEQMSTVFGMPTRSDLDAAFRKITELERALRTLRDSVQSIRRGGAQASAPKAQPVDKNSPAAKRAPSKPPAKAATKGKRK
jgi:hypothetical protein